MSVGNGMRRSVDAGETWTSLPIDVPLASAAFTSGGVGFAVGGKAVLRSNDGGATWLTLPDAPVSSLVAVCPIDATTAFAAGYDGSILRSGDGGQSWRIQKGTSEESLGSISFANRNTGYIVGRWGSIFETSNGGKEWRRVALSDDFFTAVAARSDGSAVLVGSYGMVLKKPARETK